MSLVHGLGVVVRHPVKAQCLGPCEQVSDALVELTLVLLHRQHVIGPASCDLLGNLPLAAHGVNGHDAVVQIQQVQQLGNGGDFVGLRLSLDLTQGQSLPVLDTGVFCVAQALTRCMAPLLPARS